MKVGLAQINTTVGDFENNVRRCTDAVAEATRLGAEMVVLPEMAVPGTPPLDILYDTSFVDACEAAAADLARRVDPGPTVVVGSVARATRPVPGHPSLLNAALVLGGGRVLHTVGKKLLPLHDVYHEPRWFLPGAPTDPVSIAGDRVGILVGEDLFSSIAEEAPAQRLAAAGARLLVCIAASPFTPDAQSSRLRHARQSPAALLYLNACGATDELVFDGGSFALDADGRLLAALPRYEESVQVVDLAAPIDEMATPEVADSDLLRRVLVLGIRDFARKNRLERAFIGLSGGVDSSLVADLAAEALGHDRVVGIALPSRHTDPRSTTAAQALAQALSIEFHTLPLEEMHAAAEKTLGDLLDNGVAAENVQARLRAVVLMSFVNSRGGFLLNTSNKTELSLGYATLYGDLAGALCPLGDLTKVQVLALARRAAEERGTIPDFVLDRPPSAELRPGQVDPFDYPEVAPRRETLVATNRSDGALRASEHKRRQAGIILKVSEKAFGSGRLIPVTRR